MANVDRVDKLKEQGVTLPLSPLSEAPARISPTVSTAIERVIGSGADNLNRDLGAGVGVDPGAR